MQTLYNPDELEPRGGHFIDGAFTELGADPIPVLRPSDLQQQGELAAGDEESVDRAVRSAHRAFREAPWARLEPRARAAVLRRWADLIVRDRELIGRLEASVSCRLYKEVSTRDVHVVANCLRFFGEYADKSPGQVTNTGEDVLSLTLSEPWGVVAGIVPWNFPLILAAWKFAPALAAGNCVVLKPSELTPYATAHLAALAIEAGVPPGVFNIIQGTGPSAGAALVKHPLVHYISFTGSTQTGAQLMADAALNGLKPVSLELGGKGPQVVFADAPNLNAVAARVAAGISYNSGQVCFAGSRLVLERSIEASFLEKVMGHLSRYRVGPTWADETTLPPLIHQPHQARVDRIVRASLTEGAELLCGGERLEGLNGAPHYAPTLLRGVSLESEAYREEIFGPVLMVQTFDELDEAIALADHPTYGLAASIHSADINKSIRAARRVQAGTVWVNDWGRRSDLTSPFGGYKQSGIGKDMGQVGYEKYLKRKSLWIQS